MTVFNKFELTQDDVYEVDLHKMHTWEAKYYMERLLVKLDPKIKEVVVIHGYNNGTALRNVVRNELKSKRVKRWLVSLNAGITRLILN